MAISPAAFDAAMRYLNRIRNGPKRRYAEAYLRFLLRDDPVEPGRPATLSYMAAQAVRMELSELLMIDN